MDEFNTGTGTCKLSNRGQTIEEIAADYGVPDSQVRLMEDGTPIITIMPSKVKAKRQSGLFSLPE
jgi:hypothetical protein